MAYKIHKSSTRNIFKCYIILNISIFLCMVSLSESFSQEKDTDLSPTIDELRTPTSPAFTLLGVEPTSIERPTTPRAVAASLLSAVSQDNSIPKNYALEVAPYWLFPHPNLTFDQYYNASIDQSFLQFLSLSLATSKIDTVDNKDLTGIGFGARTLLIAGKANSELASLRLQLMKKQDEMLDNKDESKEVVLRQEAKKIALRIQAIDHQRVGWMLALASASTWNFPNDNFDKGKFSRFGFWITPSYRLEVPKGEINFDFLGVGRFLRDEENKQNLFDTGGRFILQYKPISLSVEYLRRFALDKNKTDGNTDRINGNIEYRISESIYITASYGKNFEQTGRKSLIAILGVSLGFGQKPSISISPTRS